MLPRITEALATNCRSASIVPESLLTNGSGQKFIAGLPHDWSRSLHHGLKKHELNLSKARSAGAISMSLLVPLLEFNQLWTAKAWQRSKRGRSGLRCCEAHQGS